MNWPRCLNAMQTMTANVETQPGEGNVEVQKRIAERDIWIHFLCIVLLALISFTIFTRQVEGTLVGNLLHHVNNVHKYETPDFRTSHLLFHTIAYHLHRLLNVSVESSAVVALLWLQFMIAAIFYKMLQLRLHEHYASGLIAIMTLLLLLVSAIYVPFFNEHIYLGQGSPNVWHSPTTLTAKPFSFLVLLFCSLMIEADKKGNAFLYGAGASIMLVLSALAKPNFVLAFAPALPIYCFFFHRKQPRIWVYAALICVPVFLVLLYQYTRQYGAGGSGGIIIDIFGPRHNKYTPSRLVSLLLLTAFPFFTLVIYPKIITHTLYALTLIAFCIAVVQGNTLAESGTRYFHGNFGWGRQIIVPMLFVMSMAHLLTEIRLRRDKRNRAKQVFLGVIFTAHLISGAIYIHKLFYGDIFF